MAANEGDLGSNWPVAIHSVEIGVTDARVFDIDENFVGARLSNGNLLVDAGYDERNISLICGVKRGV